MRLTQTLMMLLAMLMMVACNEKKTSDEGDENKEKLAAYVEKLDRQCPFTVEDDLDIISVEYDEEDNMVTLQMSFDDAEVANALGDEDVRNSVKGLMLTEFAKNVPKLKKLMQLSVKAKAGMLLSLKDKGSDETFELKAKTRDIKKALAKAREDEDLVYEPDVDEMPDSVVEDGGEIDRDDDDEEEEIVLDDDDDDEDESERLEEENFEQQLRDGVNVARRDLPTVVDSDMTLTDVQLSSRELVYEFTCNENDVTVAQMRQAGDLMKETMLSSFNASMRELCNMCVKTNRGLAFKFVGQKSGDIFVVSLTTQEIIRSMR